MCGDECTEDGSEKAQILLDGEASHDVVAINRCTALDLAADSGKHDLVRVLRNAGAGLSGCTASGWTPLMSVACNRNMEATRVLCEAGVDVSARSLSGV